MPNMAPYAVVNLSGAMRNLMSPFGPFFTKLGYALATFSPRISPSGVFVITAMPSTALPSSRSKFTAASRYSCGSFAGTNSANDGVGAPGPTTITTGFPVKLAKSGSPSMLPSCAFSDPFGILPGAKRSAMASMRPSVASRSGITTMA